MHSWQMVEEGAAYSLEIRMHQKHAQGGVSDAAKYREQDCGKNA